MDEIGSVAAPWGGLHAPVRYYLLPDGGRRDKMASSSAHHLRTKESQQEERITRRAVKTDTPLGSGAPSRSYRAGSSDEG